MQSTHILLAFGEERRDNQYTTIASFAPAGLSFGNASEGVRCPLRRGISSLTGMEVIPVGETESLEELRMPRQSTYESEKSLRDHSAPETPDLPAPPGHDLFSSNRAIHPEVQDYICVCESNVDMQCEAAAVSEDSLHILSVYIDMCSIICDKNHCFDIACSEVMPCIVIDPYQSSLHCSPGARVNR